MARLSKYSIGIGDRFAQEAVAQLKAVQKAQQLGVLVTPVWNKSFREHQIIGSHPQQTAQAAQTAVNQLGWQQNYFLDADHINQKTVDFFLPYCNFFTIDVAEALNRPLPPHEREYLQNTIKLLGQSTQIASLAPFKWTDAFVNDFLDVYGAALLEARTIYRKIVAHHSRQSIVIEVSLDEGPQVQSPAQLFLILHLFTHLGLQLNTIAPRFVGQFLKGIDYRGSLRAFSEQVSGFLTVLQWFQHNTEQPTDLKLSVHTGSDKFRLYPILHRLLHSFDCGLHLKTAGTTWLEELIGLAEAGQEGLAFVKTLYRQAVLRIEELLRPYATVVAIDVNRLPTVEQATQWTAQQWIEALRHQPKNPQFNPDLRQLLHIAYGLAAEQGATFFELLQTFRSSIEHHVTTNLFERHLKPLFVGKEQSNHE